MSGIYGGEVASGDRKEVYVVRDFTHACDFDLVRRNSLPPVPPFGNTPVQPLNKVRGSIFVLDRLIFL